MNAYSWFSQGGGEQAQKWKLYVLGKRRREMVKTLLMNTCDKAVTFILRNSMNKLYGEREEMSMLVNIYRNTRDNVEKVCRKRIKEKPSLKIWPCKAARD